MRIVLLLLLPLLAACAADPASRLDVSGALGAPQSPAPNPAEGKLEILDLRSAGAATWALTVRATDPVGRRPAILGAWAHGRPWSYRAGGAAGVACAAASPPCPGEETGTILISAGAMADAARGPGLGLLLSGETANFRATLPPERIRRAIGG